MLAELLIPCMGSHLSILIPELVVLGLMIVSKISLIVSLPLVSGVYVAILDVIYFYACIYL